MKYLITIWTAVVCLFAVSCEEPVDRQFGDTDSDLIAVEAVMTNERIRHVVKITKPFASVNGTAQPVSGAVVTISVGGQSANLVEFPAGSGNYYTPEVRAITGVTYRLSIIYEGKTFLAEDRAVPVEPMPALEYRNTAEGFRIVNQPVGQDPNYISHDLYWGHLAECSDPPACRAKVFFYDLKTIDVHEIFKPEKEIFTFPRNTIVIRKKYSVSAAYRDFLRSMLSETEWRGGLFDVQRANVPTNLSEGAVGFFAVTTVVSDTTVVR